MLNYEVVKFNAGLSYSPGFSADFLPYIHLIKRSGRKGEKKYGSFKNREDTLGSRNRQIFYEKIKEIHRFLIYQKPTFKSFYATLAYINHFLFAGCSGNIPGT